jgi:acyl carrier protein
VSQVRVRVVAFLREMRPGLAEWPDDARLVGSDRVDSLGLMQLAVWVEGELGRPLDTSSFDLATEWDTVGSLVRFIERRGAPAA